MRQCIRVPGGDSDMVWRILYGEEGVNTANNVTVNVRGRFSTNNVDIMKVLAARAAGIAALNPALLVDAQDRGALVFPSMRSASDSKLGACSAVPTYAGA